VPDRQDDDPEPHVRYSAASRIETAKRGLHLRVACELATSRLPKRFKDYLQISRNDRFRLGIDFDQMKNRTSDFVLRIGGRRRTAAKASCEDNRRNPGSPKSGDAISAP
jgi:hypothetical protein